MGKYTGLDISEEFTYWFGIVIDESGTLWLNIRLQQDEYTYGEWNFPLGTPKMARLVLIDLQKLITDALLGNGDK